MKTGRVGKSCAGAGSAHKAIIDASAARAGERSIAILPYVVPSVPDAAQRDALLRGTVPC
jgi:hypothetical protein